MKKQIRQYAPDSQTTLGGGMDNTVLSSQETGNVNTGSPDEHSESGPVNDSDEDESGVDRREKNAGSLTGTDNDETGSGENMATES